MEARPTGSGGEPSSPNRGDQCRGQARHPLSWLLAVALALPACGGGGGAPPPRYFSTQVHAPAELATHADVPYSTRPNEHGTQLTADERAALERGSGELSLLMDVVVPPNATSATPQPLLVWLHGGGLVAGSKAHLVDIARGWAQAGYVVASINYRLTPELQARPALRTHVVTQAAEDVMSALRFLRAHAQTYHIDPDRVATIGYSSGGVLSLVNAIEADTLVNAVPDYPGQSARVNAAISTGATLLGDDWNSDPVLVYEASDAPVLLMHAYPVDDLTHESWAGTVLPTAARIDGSGNSCQLFQQPQQLHTADMSFGGGAFPTLHAFLMDKLRLAGVRQP